jgi:protein arginine kinase activator
MKCDKCDKQATVHVTEIVGGQKIERHLCEDCAASEGVAVKADISISQLLKDFVLQTSDAQEDELTCDVCGQTFKDFREHGLLGCPNDYDQFEAALAPVIQRAQEGASEHVGKVPHRADGEAKQHVAVLRLRAELREAVAGEDYERAAALRDQIREYEGL